MGTRSRESHDPGNKRGNKEGGPMIAHKNVCNKPVCLAVLVKLYRSQYPEASYLRNMAGPFVHVDISMKLM